MSQLSRTGWLTTPHIHISSFSFLVAPLLVLSPHLITEGIVATSGALLGERRIDRASSQATEAIAVTAAVLRGITVLARGWHVTGVELDAVVLAAKQAALSTASVSVAAAAHDVAKTDAAGLAVPEAHANQEEENGTQDDGQGDDESLAVGNLGFLVGRKLGAGDVEVDGRGLLLLGGVVALAVEGDGDVVVAAELAVRVFDVEGPETKGSRDLVKVVALLLVLFARGVVDVEAGKDHHGSGGVVGVLVLEVVWIPGDCDDVSGWDWADVKPVTH